MYMYNINNSAVFCSFFFFLASRKEFKAVDLDGYENMPVATLVSMLFYRGADLCNLTLTNSNVKTLFARNYDLVIVEIFGTEAFIGLGQIFDCPVIGFSSFSTSRWTNDLVGNPSPLSYISHPMLDFPDKMNFLHRMHNTVFYMYESMVLSYLHHPLQVHLIT